MFWRTVCTIFDFFCGWKSRLMFIGTGRRRICRSAESCKSLPKSLMCSVFAKIPGICNVRRRVRSSGG